MARADPPGPTPPLVRVAVAFSPQAGRAFEIALELPAPATAFAAIRAGQVQLTDGYVVIRDGELWLIGCRINPLGSASTHVQPEADRTKKLLMHKEEIRRLIGKVEQKGFTLVPLDLHYKGGRVKAEIALAKGKAEHDKRNTEKKRDWEREHGRLMRHKVSAPTKH